MICFFNLPDVNTQVLQLLISSQDSDISLPANDCKPSMNELSVLRNHASKVPASQMLCKMLTTRFARTMDSHSDISVTSCAMDTKDVRIEGMCQLILDSHFVML